jgi:hypothetical protein
MLYHWALTLVLLQARTQALLLQGPPSTAPSTSGVELKLIQDLIHRFGDMEDRERQKDAHIATLQQTVQTLQAEARISDQTIHTLQEQALASEKVAQTFQQSLNELQQTGKYYILYTIYIIY